MNETSEKIKSILYSVLEDIAEKKIQTEIIHGKSAKLIEEIVSRCRPKIIELSGNTDENLGIFAESLMHYLLTTSLIPSQRKIVVNNTELDLVIPDSKTLISKPNNSLLIFFAKSKDWQQIKHRYQQLNKLQPQKNNIWVVTSHDFETDCKVYSINREMSFSKILDDLTAFVSPNQARFKIFKAY